MKWFASVYLFKCLLYEWVLVSTFFTTFPVFPIASQGRRAGWTYLFFFVEIANALLRGMATTSLGSKVRRQPLGREAKNGLKRIENRQLSLSTRPHKRNLWGETSNVTAQRLDKPTIGTGETWRGKKKMRKYGCTLACTVHASVPACQKYCLSDCDCLKY